MPNTIAILDAGGNTVVVPTLDAVISGNSVLKIINSATETHLGEVGGNSIVAGGSFARPTNTTAYSSGQLVGNSVTAGSIVPITCTLARKTGGTGVITGIRLSKTTSNLVNASFRVHLFKNSPTTAVGDGGTFAGSINGVAAICLGYYDLTMDQAYSDGAKGFVAASGKVFDTVGGSQNLYALIEARGAYTPGNGETFALAVEALRD